ncbi:ACT domain-containing protein [Leptospira sp. WS58.C1]|jgi:UTP:GlnB (protein PII) uridylyltransferase|uniref:ACT domain-containing protein n=1 Tax=Leptospira TaxID=171 RepID=UPI0002BE7E3E|nr:MULTISPECIES: ACT domain-containing protein [unclassified Leptospira]EMK00637.1 ACT domain protein [Leptospira sp. B5-022]MCR1792208.1 amino acid-binding protein [Leptospira sp. id769339]
MIEFNYKEEYGVYRVTLKTSETAPGTLHKMVKAMFFMGFEILSGDIRTIKEGESMISYDEFLLRSSETDSKIKASKLGILMSSVFSDDNALEEMIQTSSEIDIRNTFYLGQDSQLEFEDLPGNSATKFYLEAPDRKGLLYFVTGVLKDLGINILSGEVRTDGKSLKAQDTFILTDSRTGLGFSGSSIEERIRRYILQSSLNQV